MTDDPEDTDTQDTDTQDTGAHRGEDQESVAEVAAGRLRLDKWLWYARFFKTRSLAARQCASGAVRIGGAPVTKAHHAVRPGDVLTFAQGRHIRVIKVVALGTRRGPAPEAQALYEDLSPPAQENAMPRPAPRPAGAGRPTKSERRATDRLRSET